MVIAHALNVYDAIVEQCWAYIHTPLFLSGIAGITVEFSCDLLAFALHQKVKKRVSFSPFVRLRHSILWFPICLPRKFAEEKAVSAVSWCCRKPI